MIISTIKKLSWILAGVIILALVVLFASIPYSASQKVTLSAGAILPTSYLLANVHIVDPQNNQVVSHQNIVVNDGKIAGIFDHDDDNTKMETIIDGKGRYVTAGLVDSHVHVFEPQDLGLYLSHGVTSVRNMAGLPAHLSWKQQQRNGNFIGARLISFSPALNAGDHVGPFHSIVGNSAHAKSLVQQYSDMGYDGIKVYNGLDQPLLESVIAEAKLQGLPVAGHPSNHMSFEDVLSLPLQSVEHVEELFQAVLKYKAKPEARQKLATTLAEYQTPVVTTLMAYHHIYQANQHQHTFLEHIDWPYLNDFTAWVGKKMMADDLTGAHAEWAETKELALTLITKDLFANGVKIAIGTDTGPALTMPGKSYHDELQHLANMGIGNDQILLAATEHAAQLLNQPTINGTISIGQQADLLLLNSNPLNDLNVLEEPDTVITQGYHLNRASLLELREQGKQHKPVYATMGWLLSGKLFN